MKIMKPIVMNPFSGMKTGNKKVDSALGRFNGRFVKSIIKNEAKGIVITPVQMPREGSDWIKNTKYPAILKNIVDLFFITSSLFNYCIKSNTLLYLSINSEL